jgi:hypothetical protein
VLAPDLGADNADVYGSLGLDPSERVRLADEGVI